MKIGFTPELGLRHTDCQSEVLLISSPKNFANPQWVPHIVLWISRPNHQRLFSHTTKTLFLLSLTFSHLQSKKKILLSISCSELLYDVTEMFPTSAINEISVMWDLRKASVWKLNCYCCQWDYQDEKASSLQSLNNGFQTITTTELKFTGWGKYPKLSVNVICKTDKETKEFSDKNKISCKIVLKTRYKTTNRRTDLGLYHQP